MDFIKKKILRNVLSVLKKGMGGRFKTNCVLKIAMMDITKLMTNYAQIVILLAEFVTDLDTTNAWGALLH